jgi:hypothetical protein
MLKGKRRAEIALAAVLVAAAPALAIAAETITYTYDAKGRLVKVERAGTVNNGVTTNYTHDKANNRTNVTVTGSPNTPPP